MNDAEKLDELAPEPDAKQADDDAKRRAHEESESRRKAEWEARQQSKKEAEQQALAELAALSDDDVTGSAVQRTGEQLERLTRRSMKQSVTERVQELCQTNPAFARLAMHPRKSMVHCFWYINRKAREFLEQEMKDNQEQPQGSGFGGDVPDELCYQWAVEYFRDPDAPEDAEKEEQFVPKPYSGGGAKPKKKEPKPKPEPKPASPEPEQITFEGLVSCCA